MKKDMPVLDPGVPHLSEGDFEKIRSTVHLHCGINLRVGKEELVKSRLAKRLRALGIKDFGEYIRRVESDRSGGELAAMIDILTTNKTGFFRESRHFEFLREHILPDLGSHSITMWSAGCSSGEEAYSLAILLAEELACRVTRHVRILATDISQRMLDIAKAGEFDEATLSDVEPRLRDKYFTRVTGSQDRMFRVNDNIRAMVRFARLNLLGDWPMNGPFDVILCRNVMIYFDAETRAQVVRRFWEMLRPGGYLFVGHSESLLASREFRCVQPAVYRRE